jgi:hypothetical protein
MRQISNNKWIIEIQKNNKIQELLVTLPKGSVDQVGWERNNSNELLAILDTETENIFL